MKPYTKNRLEDAVHKVSRSLGELLAVFEECGEDISIFDNDKVFNFLNKSLTVIEEKASHAREIAAVTRGSFSLDDDVNPAPRMPKPLPDPVAPPRTPPVAAPPIPATDRAALIEERKAMGGRLSAHSPELHPELETAPVFPSSGSDYVQPGIDFMDDE